MAASSSYHGLHVNCIMKEKGCEKIEKREIAHHVANKCVKCSYCSIMAATAVKFQNDLEEQAKKLEEQAMKLEEHEKKLEQQERKFEEKLQEQKESFEKEITQLKERYDEVIQASNKSSQFGELEFTMEKFSEEKGKGVWSNWKSPPMYTHVGGYKFFMSIASNGFGEGYNDSVDLGVWYMKGEFDDQLKWPFKGRFTVQLVNHFPGGVNKEVVEEKSWDRPKCEYGGYSSFSNFQFISHAELDCDNSRKTHFLKDDCLQFRIPNITLMN